MYHEYENKRKVEINAGIHSILTKLCITEEEEILLVPNGIGPLEFVDRASFLSKIYVYIITMSPGIQHRPDLIRYLVAEKLFPSPDGFLSNLISHMCEGIEGLKYAMELISAEAKTLGELNA